jgi:large-conductance mechanosensitive channel
MGNDVIRWIRERQTIAVPVVLVVGYVYVQVIRSVVHDLLLPLFETAPRGFADYPSAFYTFEIGDHVLQYDNVVTWGVTLVVVLGTLVLLERRLR